LQVRLLHCAIRRYLLQRPRGWNVEQNGVPINMEDMSGTLSLFCIVLIGGLEKLGMEIDNQRKNDIHHLWRWVGYLLGIRSPLLTETFEDQRSLSHAIKAHQWSPNERSQKLTKALFSSLDFNWRYVGLPAAFCHALSRFLLGDSVADEYDLPHSSKFWKVVVYVYSLAVRYWSLVLRYIPFAESISCYFHGWLWEVILQLGLQNSIAQTRTVEFKLKQY